MHSDTVQKRYIIKVLTYIIIILRPVMYFNVSPYKKTRQKSDTIRQLKFNDYIKRDSNHSMVKKKQVS